VGTLRGVAVFFLKLFDITLYKKYKRYTVCLI